MEEPYLVSGAVASVVAILLCFVAPGLTYRPTHSSGGPRGVVLDDAGQEPQGRSQRVPGASHG